MYVCRNTQGTTTDVRCIPGTGFIREGGVGYVSHSDVTSCHIQSTNTNTNIQKNVLCRQNHGHSCRHIDRYTPWRVNMGDGGLHNGSPPDAPTEPQNGSSSDKPPDPSGSKLARLRKKRAGQRGIRWPRRQHAPQAGAINWVRWVGLYERLRARYTAGRTPGCGYALVPRCGYSCGYHMLYRTHEGFCKKIIP